MQWGGAGLWPVQAGILPGCSFEGIHPRVSATSFQQPGKMPGATAWKAAPPTAPLLGANCIDAVETDW